MNALLLAFFFWNTKLILEKPLPAAFRKSHRLGHREEAHHNRNESVPFRSDHAYALLPMKPK